MACSAKKPVPFYIVRAWVADSTQDTGADLVTLDEFDTEEEAVYLYDRTDPDSPILEVLVVRVDEDDAVTIRQKDQLYEYVY